MLPTLAPKVITRFMDQQKAFLCPYAFHAISQTPYVWAQRWSPPAYMESPVFSFPPGKALGNYNDIVFCYCTIQIFM